MANENLLKELGDVLDFNLDSKKDIEFAVSQLLDELKFLQLGNLSDDQVNLVIRLISHNELRMHPFKKIYERNKTVIKQIMLLTKSKDSKALDSIANMFKTDYHLNKEENITQFKTK